MKNILREIFLLNGLTDEVKQSVLKKLAKPMLFKKGTVIYSNEHFPDAIGFVISGKAVAVTNNQSGLYMQTFSKCDCFGAAAIFGNGGDYVSNITAKTDVEIVFVTENELKKLFEEFPVIAVNYITFLTQKIRFLNKKLSLISCSSSEDTLFKYLSSVTDKDGVAKIPKSMTLLAKMLGMGRATLYRALDSLEANGYIIKNNNLIKVIKNEKNS